MLKTRLLPALCSVGLLAAVPAFAQGNMQGGTQDQYNNSGASGMSTGQDMSGGTGSQRTHMRSARTSRGSGDAQNAEVDRLNQQSLQAAQQGQTMSGSSDTGTSSGSGYGSSGGYGGSSGGSSYSSPGMSGSGGPGTMQNSGAAPGTTPTR